MSMGQSGVAPSSISKSRLLSVVACLATVCVMTCAVCADALAQGPARSEPVRFYNVDGRVLLPDDRPAVRVRVRLSGRGGINRETYTNDNGGFEFTELPAGVYSLTAMSLIDTSLVSSAEADTNRTAVGTVTVNMSLRATEAKSRTKPGVVAIAEAEQVVPREALKAYRQGLKWKDDEQFDKALESFSHAIELYPDYFQALSERGDLRVSRRELKEAANDFERALKLNQHYTPALRGAGYCNLESRDFTQATQYLERAATIEPSNLSTLLLLGIAYMELDRRDAARQSLRKALKIDADRAVRAHIYLANLYAREGQYQQAADELRLYLNAVIADPDYDKMRQVEARWRTLAEKK